MTHRMRPLTSLFACTALLLTALPLIAVSFTAKVQSGQSSVWHADFNGDGREDIIAPAAGGLTVQLSNGAGTYSAPKFYALSSGKSMHDAAIGQFCCAGDFIAIDGQTAHLFVFAGNGTGNFTVTTKGTPNGDIPLNIVAGDFNHDGNMDIAYIAQNSSGQSFIQVLFGPQMGFGDFSLGPMTVVPDFQPGQAMYVGDFDGDGKADLMTCNFGTQAANPVFVHYGDGAGNFPTSVELTGESGSCGRVFDLNGDGKSDVVFHPYAFGSSQGNILVKEMAVYYGNAARTWSATNIPTDHFVSDDDNTAVADFNGDGIPDLVFIGADTSSDAAPFYFLIKTGKGGGAFNPDVVLTELAPGALYGMDTLRSIRNNKPDFAITRCGTSCSSPSLYSFLNSTSGAFPSCTAPSGFQGIAVCGPGAGATVSSPVSFRVGAVTQTPARKVELWIDGKKVGEQLKHAFSHYAFLNKSVSLASGKHSVTVFAAGWDNWVEKKSFSITVN